MVSIAQRVCDRKRESKSKLWLPCGHHGAGSPVEQCLQESPDTEFNSDRASNTEKE